MPDQYFVNRSVTMRGRSWNRPNDSIKALHFSLGSGWGDEVWTWLTDRVFEDGAIPDLDYHLVDEAQHLSWRQGGFIAGKQTWDVSFPEKSADAIGIRAIREWNTSLWTKGDKPANYTSVMGNLLVEHAKLDPENLWICSEDDWNYWQIVQFRDKVSERIYTVSARWGYQHREAIVVFDWESITDAIII